MFTQITRTKKESFKITEESYDIDVIYSEAQSSKLLAAKSAAAGLTEKRGQKHHWGT